jgi:SAM-dependent methyltransferase
MFAPDIISIRQFYATPLGAHASRLIGKSIKRLWPGAHGDTVLGIGYATPFLEPYLDRAAGVFSCMPAQQGAAYWPVGKPNLALLAHDSELPFPEGSINRILLVHSVENSEQLSWMMQEIWRVLTPGGRVLALVPNRLSFWSRSSRSPFGYGRPFTAMQLRDLLVRQQFAPTRSSSVLFTPPTRLEFLWRMAGPVELIGRLLFPFLGGVLMVEAEKQVYASIRQPAMARQSYRATAAAT